MQKIYVVEDDENIRELAVYALNTAGFRAFGFETGSAFFSQLNKSIPELILLDIMLPDEDGISILKKLRSGKAWQKLPVIMLTAKGSEYDRVKGLDTGADDYIVKPFFVMELISRVKAVLRRYPQQSKEALFIYKDLQLDATGHFVKVDGQAITLTLKEFELLHYLLLNLGLVLSREKIVEKIWGYEFEGESRTVDMHVKTLRQKLGSAGEHIQTIRGIGYKLGEKS